MEKKLLWVGLALLAVVILAAALTSLLGGPSNLHGFAIDPPLEAPEVALNDQTGAPFALSAQGGNVVLLFFGYTSCPDECPITLAKLKQTRILLGDQADLTRVVLVTTDPADDTPQVLGAYLAGFDPSYVGLTGPAEALQAAYAAYGVTVMDEGETHSSRVYLIDPAGMLRATYPYEFDPQDLAADVRAILNER